MFHSFVFAYSDREQRPVWAALLAMKKPQGDDLRAASLFLIA
jgi:hypothetical protein